VRWLVVLSLAMVAPSAWGAVDSDLLKAGMAACEDLDYERGLPLLEKALSESLTRDEKLAAHRTLAFCRVALGDEKGAFKDFQAVLRLNPHFVLDRRISPRVRKVFDQAKASMPPPPPLPVTVPVAEAPPKKPVWKKGWFWGTLAGIVVAGAVVGGAVAATTAGPSADTPATLTIEPH
jgi:hypothetical protein